MTQPPPAPTDFQPWVGRTQTETDEATLAPLRALAATLGLDERFEAGSALPPLWHWLYFLPTAPRAEIGPDGHPKRGGFLPPVTLPRRMWAGSKLEWPGELRAGERIVRQSTIESVESKSGKSGTLVFVKVRHEVGAEGAAPAVREWQDIVYREPPPASSASAAPAPAPAAHSDPAPAWQQRWEADPVLLFRFSALTFNGHRIHYDRPYAMNEEGYPGLVVHGPLLAVLMMQLARARQPRRRVREFQFRGLSPVIDTAPFDVCGVPDAGGASAELSVRSLAGTAMTQGRVVWMA